MKAKPKTTPLASRAKRLILKKSATETFLPFSGKTIFERSVFLVAPGGDRYEWKETETVFEAPQDGLFAIKIEASAKNAGQNRSANDDDLRVALDGFDFGKYEVHDETVSWKGFGTSSSWDGASLKGGTKTIYFFAELQKGRHTLQFFADQTPRLKNIEVFEIQNNLFERFSLKPSENILSNENGIPWLSFVFLGTAPKTVTLEVKTKSGKTKGTKDGDNLKVVVNGKTLKSPVASISDKYKNFYFSGDLQQQDTLAIPHTQLSRPLAFENAVELWYDEEPEIVQLKIEFLDEKEIVKFLQTGALNVEELKEQIRSTADFAVQYFRKKEKIYSATFLEHALTVNPEPLVFESHDPLIKKVQKDPTYQKILKKIKEKITAGILDGEIWPIDFKDDPQMQGHIDFDSEDLLTALHGIRKIEYEAQTKGNNQYQVDMKLFDVYDFEKQSIPFFLPLKPYLKAKIINQLNLGEELNIIHNFEIEVHITETIDVFG